MALAFYFDVHVQYAIAAELRKRSVDVLRAREDGTDEAPDPLLLDRATELGRVLVSSDRDFLVEVPRRQEEGLEFAGLVSFHPTRVAIGKVVEDLELMAKAMELEEMQNRLVYLPF